MKRTVLVADDDPNDRLLIELAFKKAGHGHSVVTVENGEDVVSYFSGEPPFVDRTLNPIPDLLLLDLKMPKINGFEVLEWLQTQPALSSLPVVVLSGSQIEDDMQKARSLGAADFKTKPSLIGDLTRIVDDLHNRWLAA